VRRLSVASLDSGAESPVYGIAPSASVGREGAAAGPPCAVGLRFRQRHLDSGGDNAMRRAAEFAAFIPADIPGDGATRACAIITGLMLPEQVSRGGARRATSYGMPVVDRAQRKMVCKQKMVCKGHPCIYAADRYPMTRLATSRAVPRGTRSLGKLTDVHGREG
jgi:hypothetical protein